MTTIVLDVTGMHCASCVARVEAALLSVGGVSQAHVNLATNQATVYYDATVDAQVLVTATTTSGYSATIAEDRRADQYDQRHAREHESRELLGQITPQSQIVGPA